MLGTNKQYKYFDFPMFIYLCRLITRIMTPKTVTTTTEKSSENIEVNNNANYKSKEVREVKPQKGCKSIIGTFEMELKWFNIINIIIIHILAIWTLAMFPYVSNFKLFAYGKFV